MRTFPRLFLSLFFLGSAHLQAQLNLTPPETKESKPAVMTIRLVSTNLSPDFKSPQWALIGQDGQAVALTLQPWSISPAIPVPPGPRILIYDLSALQASLKTKGQSLPTPLFDLAVPAGSQKCLVVAKGGGVGGWKCEVYDESTGHYAGGSRLFINLTPYRLSGSCGKTSIDIPGQGISLVKPQVDSSDRRGVVQVYAELPTRKATVLDEQWIFPARSRGIVLVFEAQGGSLRLVGIPDEEAPAPKGS